MKSPLFENESDSDRDTDNIHEWVPLRQHTSLPEEGAESASPDDDMPLPQLPRSGTSNPPTATSPSHIPPPSWQLPTTWPTFTPFSVLNERRTTCGRPNYFYFRNSAEDTHLHVFKTSVSTYMVHTIARDTNLYAIQEEAGRRRRWNDATWQDIQTFALAMYMGVYKSPCIEGYWGTTGKLPMLWIMTAMGM